MNGYCYILCADGYVEKAVQEAWLILPGERLVPVFLGLKRGRIRGATGGRVMAQALISQVTGEDEERPLPGGLLLAGGAECGHSLLADPRVHLLTGHMLAAGRPVGLLRPVCYSLFEMLADRSAGSSILLQGSQTTADFIRVFVQRLSESGPIGSIIVTGAA